jgi:oligopeptide transport system ATP-binding protein
VNISIPRRATWAPPPESDGGCPLLEVLDLRVEFRVRDRTIVANNGVSYTLAAGETLAILGESGSGKTVSAAALMGLIDSPPGFVAGGEIRLHGVDLLRLPERERRRVRGETIAMVFQDALTALNPAMTVGDQIAEPFRSRRGIKRAAARAKAVELMERVQIPDAARRASAYPHEFSGGMRQRAVIAMALALEPEILVADEPTTALDVTVQAQIMGLLADLQRELNMALILITHDLGVVANVADRVAIMYAGKIVETADARELYARPAHPYTRGLLASVPRVDIADRRLVPIVGVPPNLGAIPSGCAFHPRCTFKRQRCVSDVPQLNEVGPSHRSACHYWKEVRDLAGR